MKRAVRRAERRASENWKLTLRETGTMVTQIMSYEGKSATLLSVIGKRTKKWIKKGWECLLVICLRLLTSAFSNSLPGLKCWQSQ